MGEACASLVHAGGIKQAHHPTSDRPRGVHGRGRAPEKVARPARPQASTFQGLVGAQCANKTNAGDQKRRSGSVSRRAVMTRRPLETMRVPQTMMMPRTRMRASKRMRTGRTDSAKPKGWRGEPGDTSIGSPGATKTDMSLMHRMSEIRLGWQWPHRRM